MSERTPVIWFVGQGRWCRLLARAVNEHGSGSLVGRPVELDQVRDGLKVLRLAGMRDDDVVVRVGFRPGALTWRGRVFDIVWRLVRAYRPRAVSAMYWIGSDVMKALRDAEAGGGGARVKRMAGPGTRHFANAPWLVDELSTIGVEAAFVQLPWLYHPVPEEAPPYPDGTFCVMSYVPDRRRDFYGWPMLLEAARALPEVRFRLVAGTGEGLGDVPDNIEFMGWVPMDGMYRACHAVARLPEHDAIGGTVLEGLAYGRPVVYTYPFAHCRCVPFGDGQALASVLRELLREWDSGRLELNTEGRDYVIRQFQPDLAVARLESMVARVVESS